jgi:hypothetical protein
MNAAHRPVGAFAALVCAIFVLSSAFTHAGAEFFAAPDGRTDGNGTMERPWDLQTALNNRAAVPPGSTMWVRGGTYSGTFVSRLMGTAEAPITVRAYPGERPILDNPSPAVPAIPVLSVEGAYVVVWGLEVTSTNPHRVAGDVSGDVRPNGINLYGPHTKLINNIVHDTGTCLGVWSQALDAEVYGNLLYFCGWDGVRGSGHGLYAQNAEGTKEIRENVVFDVFGFGIHAYTEGGAIDDLHFRRNVSFESSALSKVTPEGAADILVGGRRVARRPVVEGNLTYRLNGTNHVGYRAGTEHATVTGNVFVVGRGATALHLVDPKSATITGNMFVGDVTNAAEYRDNVYEPSPHGIWRFVLPNEYEPNRATIVVYNWDRADTVDVDAPSFLAAGDRYELRNVQDYFGDAIVRTHHTGAVTLPMRGRTVAVPVGWHAPRTTFPDFGVFVLIKKTPVSKH